MKERMHKVGKCGILMALVLVLSMVFGMLVNVRAAENAGSEPEPYNPKATGSITMVLPDKSAEGLNREGVQVYLYKVGDLDTSHGYLDFSLTETYKDVAVDLNDITTGADNEAVAQALAEFIAADASIEPTGEVWTGADGNAVITNVYTDDLPDGYYYTGDLTITKSVMDNGQMITSQDTFYAGVFTVDAQGNLSPAPSEIVKLNNNGSVTIEVPLGGTDDTQPVTYAIRETDENGTLVNKETFLYTVTGEGNVNLSMDQTSGTINITNTLKGEEGYYQEEPSTQEPSTADPGDGSESNGSSRSGDSGSGSSRSSRSGKTGDDNQIVLYAGLLAAAVIIGGAVIVRRRRRSNR